MSNGFQYLDLILYLAIALFLMIRLGRVLGRRVGPHRPPHGSSSPPHRDGETAERPARGTAPNRPLKSLARVASPTAEQEEEAEEVLPDPEAAFFDGAAGAGLKQIQALDPSFKPTAFLQGAEQAFAMVLRAYVADDRDTLWLLLASAVFEQFAATLETRKAAQRKCGDTLVSIVDAKIIEATVHHRRAEVVVRFVTEQINVVYDAAKAVVEGDPKKVRTVIDVWTFARDTAAADPNWELTATRAG